jgi:hypothetical protein
MKSHIFQQQQLWGEWVYINISLLNKHNSHPFLPLPCTLLAEYTYLQSWALLEKLPIMQALKNFPALPAKYTQI